MFIFLQLVQVKKNERGPRQEVPVLSLVSQF